jgi:hypothetical protein
MDMSHPKERRSLRIFVNRELNRILGSKRKEGTGD